MFVIKKSKCQVDLTFLRAGEKHGEFHTLFDQYPTEKRMTHFSDVPKNLSVVYWKTRSNIRKN